MLDPYRTQTRAAQHLPRPSPWAGQPSQALGASVSPFSCLFPWLPKLKQLGYRNLRTILLLEGDLGPVEKPFGNFAKTGKRVIMKYPPLGEHTKNGASVHPRTNLFKDRAIPADVTRVDTRYYSTISDANDGICMGGQMWELHSVLTANRIWDRRTADSTSWHLQITT